MYKDEDFVFIKTVPFIIVPPNKKLYLTSFGLVIVIHYSLAKSYRHTWQHAGHDEVNEKWIPNFQGLRKFIYTQKLQKLYNFLASYVPC